MPADVGRNTQPRYNIAPTQDVLFVTPGEDGGHKLRESRWWLVPWWAKGILEQLERLKAEPAIQLPPTVQ